VRDGLPIKTDPGPHSGRPRIFDSEIVTAWLIDQALAEAGKTGALDRGQEQARLFAVQADRQTLALQRELGEMIPGAVVEKVWSGMTSAARARLLAVPSRLAAECSGQPFEIIASRAEELIFQALEEIHQYNPEDYQ
jgi:phage terminase Nu1 subunit (DNA packaging protein)